VAPPQTVGMAASGSVTIATPRPKPTDLTQDEVKQNQQLSLWKFETPIGCRRKLLISSGLDLARRTGRFPQLADP
jgi:hypothetical protein